MDICAELTLRILKLAQVHDNPGSAPVRWFFFPDFRPVGWDEAGETLAAAAKPLLVAPLIEPGALALWSSAEMAPSARERLERAFANQAEFYEAKILAFKLQAESSLSLSTPDGEFAITVADFRRWFAAYSLAVGVGVIAASQGAARLTVRRPGGGRPLGIDDAPTREEL